MLDLNVIKELCDIFSQSQFIDCLRLDKKLKDIFILCNLAKCDDEIEKIKNWLMKNI